MEAREGAKSGVERHELEAGRLRDGGEPGVGPAPRGSLERLRETPERGLHAGRFRQPVEPVIPEDRVPGALGRGAGLHSGTHHRRVVEQAQQPRLHHAAEGDFLLT